MGESVAVLSLGSISSTQGQDYLWLILRLSIRRVHSSTQRFAVSVWSTADLHSPADTARQMSMRLFFGLFWNAEISILEVANFEDFAIGIDVAQTAASRVYCAVISWHR